MPILAGRSSRTAILAPDSMSAVSMPNTVSEQSPDPALHRARRGLPTSDQVRPAVRVVLLAAVLLCGVGRLWAHPHTFSPRHLLLSAQRGEVVSAVATSRDDVLWTDGVGRRYLEWTPEPSGEGTGAAMGAIEEARRVSPRPIAASPWLVPDKVLDVGTETLILSVALFFFIGPAPRVGGRWFWFWFLCLREPGALLYLVMSGPFPGGRVVRARLDGTRRRTGWEGWAMAIATSLSLALSWLAVKVLVDSLR